MLQSPGHTSNADVTSRSCFQSLRRIADISDSRFQHSQKTTNAFFRSFVVSCTTQTRRGLNSSEPYEIPSDDGRKIGRENSWSIIFKQVAGVYQIPEEEQDRMGCQKSRLTAYHFFNTFNEDLAHIGRAMGVDVKTFDERVQDMRGQFSRKGQVAVEILAITYDAKLPLRQQDSELLSYWSKFSPGTVSPVAQVKDWTMRSIDLEVRDDAGVSEAKARRIRYLSGRIESASVDPQASTTKKSSKLNSEKPFSRFADLSALPSPDAPSVESAHSDSNELKGQMFWTPYQSAKRAVGISPRQREEGKRD